MWNPDPPFPIDLSSFWGITMVTNLYTSPAHWVSRMPACFPVLMCPSPLLPPSHLFGSTACRPVKSNERYWCSLFWVVPRLPVLAGVMQLVQQHSKTIALNPQRPMATPIALASRGPLVCVPTSWIISPRFLYAVSAPHFQSAQLWFYSLWARSVDFLEPGLPVLILFSQA